MRSLFLFFFTLLVSAQLLAESIQGEQGSLVYSDGVGGAFNTLVYEKNTGGVRRVFDTGLTFNYNASNLSPDKKYSVVQFSESGEGTSGPESIYLCAFVRMSDGCVVSVAAGEQCGGEWGGRSQWRSSITTDTDDFLKNSPMVDKVYKDYLSGRKDLTQISSPRVLAYIPEGTTFDNLLTCDPPRDVNRKTYSDMLQLLERDGDTSNVAKLKTVMNTASIRSAEEGSSPATKANDVKVKSVISEKAYLYRSPLLSDKTASYLIRGDVVSVLSNTNNSFVKFRYTQKNGAVIEKWIRCEDVDSCGPK